MKVTKDAKLFGIGFLVVLSLIFMILPLLNRKSGAIVVDVSPDSVCKEIFLPGSVITKMNLDEIKNPDDFYSVVDGLEGRVNLMINGGPRVCEIGLDEKIDIEVTGYEKKGIKFGIDIDGGREFVLETSNISEVLSILETRFKTYGLKDVDFREISDNSLNIIFIPEDEHKVEKLLELGLVSAKFMNSVEIKNSTGKFSLNDKSYDIKVNDDVLEIDGKNYKIDDEFLLDEINIKVKNVTENYTTFLLDVFDSGDVEEVLTDEQNSRVFQNQGQYVFVLNVKISEEASERFIKTTKGQPLMINPQGEDYLQNPLVIFADDKTITTIPIPKSEMGIEIDQFVIWGVENRKEDANEKMSLLTGFLKTGELSDVKIIERKNVEPEKKHLLNLVVYLLLGIVALSCVCILIRYKDVKVVGLVLGVFGIEFLLVLGSLTSNVFLFILSLSCVTFAFITKEKSKWMKFITIGLMFLISFSGIVNKIIVDSYILIGLMIGSFVSLIHLVIASEVFAKSSKYERFFAYLWKISFVLVLLLTVLFFVQDYRNVAIASTIILMVSLTLTKPKYAQIIKDLKD